jgi:RNA polymerase sigma factor (sigma-70 family)
MSEAAVPLVRDQVAVQEPFDAVYLREFRPMMRLAMALVDSPEQAEEVVQEAFAALYLRYRVVSNPVAYVRVSVLNGGRKVLRRRRVVRRQPNEVEQVGDLGFNHVLDAVRRLPSRQRNVVTLRYELQLTEQEIADTLGIPIGTVKSTLHRALARLRTEVTE